MIYKVINITLLTLMFGYLTIAVQPALAQYIAKDSFYFMKDDGVFSDEEKDEEAEFIEKECRQTVLHQQYYDCACIAGAFRQERDKEKLMPQDLILSKLYNDKNSKCVDKVKIAGNGYNFCKGYTDYFRTEQSAADNEEYCTCVANKIVKDFAAAPRLRSRFISRLRVSAMGACDTNRAQPLSPVDQ